MIVKGNGQSWIYIYHTSYNDNCVSQECVIKLEFDLPINMINNKIMHWEL